MSVEKKISVIIPCHNAVKYLPQCFMSLVKQTIGMEALELLFIDDASDDNGATWDMLQEMERAYPQSIAVIHLEENMRQGGARNTGMKYAMGEYLAFVDADDWVEDTFLDKVYQYAKKENADIVQFGHKVFVDSVGVIEELGGHYQGDILKIESIEQRKEMLMSEKLTYGCWNKIYRRSMVQKAGAAFAEHVIYEEPLFVYPLLFFAKNFVILEDQLYYYRQNFEGTMHSHMNAEDSLWNHAQVQKQTWDFMKQTPFFSTYYEEIKFYFFHTYLYETLYFAGNRNMRIPLETLKNMYKDVQKELGTMVQSIYFDKFPAQKELADMILQDFTQEELNGYIDKITVK